MKLSIDQRQLDSAGALLPFEKIETVGGIERPVPIEYLLMISGATEGSGKASGVGYLKVGFISDYNSLNMRVTIERIFSYQDSALIFLSMFAQMINWKAPLDTDDIIGRYVWATIAHEDNKFVPKGKTEEVTTKKVVIKEFIREATPEEVEEVMKKNTLNDIPAF